MEKEKLKKSEKITLNSNVLILGVVINILFLFSLFLFIHLNPNVNSKELKITKIEDAKEKEAIKNYEYVEEIKNTNKKAVITSTSNKSITIEKINMFDEPIYEGVDQDTLKENIGHFPSSSDFNGNVCLAAHNYGVYSSDLFKNLSNLNVGDKITYNFNGNLRKYAVKEIYEVASNDLSILEKSDSNILTCITCTKNNDKDIRICLRAEEIKGEY